MQSRAARGAGVRGRRVAVRQAVAGVEALEQRRLMSVTNLIEGANSVTAANTTLTGMNLSADPAGAVGPAHLVNAVNSRIQWYTKSGVVQHDESLNAFFATIPGVTSTSRIFSPKLTYDQYNNRFVMLAVWQQDFNHQIAGTDPAQYEPVNDSHVLLAVSDDADPNGTWYFQDVKTKLTIQGQDTWLDSPGLGVSQDAIYLTGNMYQFGYSTGTSDPVTTIQSFVTGGLMGTRLFIIPKTPLYAGGQSFVQPTGYDPVTTLGLTPGAYAPGINAFVGLQPAHMYGATPTGVGTFLTLDAGDDSQGRDRVYVIRVDNPLGIPAFTATLLDVGDISTRAFDGVSQAFPTGTLDSKAFPKLYGGDSRITSAVWRNGQLFATSTVIPGSGPDVGQTTVHWFQFGTGTSGSIATPTVVDQGNVGGEEIGVGVHTFFPAVSVNAGGDIAIGFSASAPVSFSNNQTTTPTTANPVYPGAYVTARLAGDPKGQTRPAQVLAAGEWLAYGSVQITPGATATINPWGSYSAVQVDPSDDHSFWAYNMYTLVGTQTVTLPDNTTITVNIPNGWGTRWGKFTAELVDLPAIGSRVWNDKNGNGVRDADEPGLAGVIFRLYDSNNNLIDQTVSDADGRWYLQAPPTGSLVPGTYRIVADISDVSVLDEFGNSLLQGFMFSPEDQLGDSTTDSAYDSDFLSPSNPLVPTGLALTAFQRSTRLITLSAGELNEHTDLGLFKPFAVLSTSTPTIKEGGPGAVHQAQFVVTLYTGVLKDGVRHVISDVGLSSPWDTKLYISTVAVSATPNVDFQSHSLDLVTVPAGQSTSAPMTVAVLGDALAEGNESFKVEILEPYEVYGFPNDHLAPGEPPKVIQLPNNSQILNESDKFATVTILDDDAPVVTVDPGPVVMEGSPGNVTYAIFTIRLSSPNRQSHSVRVNYTLSNGTATGGPAAGPGVDFDNTGGFVDFAPGEMTKTVRVAVFGDFVKNEKNETFGLTITPAAGSELTAGPTSQLTATATILDLNMQTITFSAKKSATYRDIAGNVVTITLSGPGKGTVTKASNGLAQFLMVKGTTERSVLTIRTNGGQTMFAGIQVVGGLAALNAPTTNVTGSLTSKGAIRNLTINYISGGQIVLGPSADPDVFVTLNIGRIVDSTLDSRTAINRLNMVSWIDTGTPDLLTAPGIKQIRVTGDFGADIETTIGNLGTLVVNGVLKGSSINVTPTFNGWTVGKIGSITVGSMLSSTVTAGKRLGTLTVRNLFSNSTIEAPQIDRLELGRIQNTTSSVLVAAEADKIGFVRWTYNNRTRQIKNVDNPGPRGLDKDVDQNPQIILQIT